MGRWSHLDSDEDRLPAGMTRVGYDADTQVYTYRDSDGSYWEGAPGVQYGKMYRVRQAAPVLPSAYVTSDQESCSSYVLHDYDPDDSYDEDSVDSDMHTLTDEEKQSPTTTTTTTTTVIVPFPDKAVLRTSIKRKPIPNTTTTTTPTADPDPDTTDTLSLASTLVDRAESIRSRIIDTARTNREIQQQNVSNNNSAGAGGLRRTGTLSRLARFLGSSSSSSSSSLSSGVARRATVGGGGGQNGQWPGSGPARQGGGNGAGGGGGGSARAARARKRATTFDEILGEGQ
ncbi:uncharacterized protein B0H64DRAFT_145826 [Chaetomium fimeti]|uniref:Uncharacterized protein n=1 Tax=Chaetomium fimeti TaxID=1854472 RepID=A0AAE0LRS1_9PEZI|nr:hypothetical protein B0H64DRAFT_145826 [Chaetomium fimeti]